MEALSKIRAVVMDKTGTITKGNFKVQQVVSIDHYTEDELLRICAGCEQHSTHPIAVSIVSAAKEKNLLPETPLSMEEAAGHGIIAETTVGRVLCGNRKLMENHHVDISELPAAVFGAEVFVAINGKLAGYLLISDTIKADAASAINQLKSLNLRTAMLTGDSEDSARAVAAQTGIEELSANVDAIVTIPNDLLLKIADKKVTINDSFKLADDILRQGVQGIIEVITQKGLINCDFADVRTIMKDSGVAHMGIGMGKGENAAQDAVRSAIESPLLETSIVGAENVLLNITGGTEFSLVDVGEVSSMIKDMVSDEANIILGSAVDDSMKDEIKVTLIATGLDGSIKRNADAGVKPKQTAQASYSAPRQERTAPSFSTQPGEYDDDAIFKRRLKPGMAEIDVPSFFKNK